MGLITFMFYVLIFSLCAGVVVSVLWFVPMSIYVLPYCLWVGSQQCAGRHLDKKNETIRKTARNATKLYKAWLLRREPTF